VRVRARRGRFTLELTRDEAGLLSSLIRSLDELVASPADADRAVWDRLFPDAYPDDLQAQTEFAALTAPGLADERRERLRRCYEELTAEAGLQGGAIDLTAAEDADRWLRVLNDLRLALGTRIGVTADPQPVTDPDPEDPEGQALVVYRYLTEVQDVIVAHVLG